MRLTTKLSDKVKNILIRNPETRDDDMLLLSLIWNQEKVFSDAMDLLASIGAGQLPNPESVRRSRQLLQQENPSLRGDKYKKRQNHVKTFVKNIKEMTKHVNPQQDILELFNETALNAIVE